MSPGNLTNTARRAQGSAFLPVAFLPIPKSMTLPMISTLNLIDNPTANKKHRGKPNFKKFCRQMYHACLTQIFQPLKAGMTTPEVVHCPDGHFRRVIYGIGPYIADYPEQVWLAAIVQNWCPKCVSIHSSYFIVLINCWTLGAMQIQITWTLKMLGGDHTKKLSFWSHALIPGLYGMILVCAAMSWFVSSFFLNIKQIYKYL